MREGEIEPTVVPRNALDVLAQQIVAIAASAGDRRRRRAPRARHAHPLLRRAAPRAARERARHARRPLPLGRVRRAAPADHLGPHRRHDPRAQGRAASSPSSTPARSPTAGCSRVTLPDGRPRRRARRGDGLRGAPGPDLPARRDGLADRGDRPRPRDRHAGARRAGRGAVLEGRLGRAPEGARRGDRRVLALGGRPARASVLERDYDLDPLRGAQPARVPARAAGARPASCPSDRTIVVERFRDEIGDWRLCVLTPFGGRVHAAWGLALSARIRERYGLESDAIWSDDGIIVHLPDTDEPPERRARAARAGRGRGARRRRARRLGAVRRALPRERGPRAADPARLPGPAHAAVAAAAEGADAARGRAPLPRLPDRSSRPTASACATCSTSPGCESLLRALARREISLVEVETPTASPFASSLLFDYVATYMYEGDAPNAERRAAALSLDRELLRELLGQEELRELIDAGALEALEADLQRRSPAPPRDLARRAARRAAHARRPDRGAGARARARRARRRRDARRAGARAPRGGGARGARAALHRGAGRRPLPRRARRRCRRRGCRTRSSPTSPTRCASSRARHARAQRPVHDRRAERALRRRHGERAARARGRGRARARRAAPDLASARARRRARVVRPGGAAAPAARVAGGAAARDRAGRAARARRASCRPGRASTATRPPAPGSSGCARSSCRCRASRCPRSCGSGRCCRGASAPTRRAGSTSSAPPARSSGSGRARSAAARARRALLPRRRRGDRPAGRRARSSSARRARARADPRAAARRAVLLRRPARARSTPPVEALQEALWDLVWAGEVTNDAWAPLRAPRLALARGAGAAGRAPGRRFAPAVARLARLDPRPGPGPLVARRAASSSRRPTRSRGGARSPSCCSSATAS